MELAEQVVPYGEHAANLRAVYLGQVMAATFGGSKPAASAAQRIYRLLFANPPQRRRRGSLVAGLLATFGRKGPHE